MPLDKRHLADNETHLRHQEREGVGYAAIITAEISSGQEVFVWFYPFSCQLVPNLNIKQFINEIDNHHSQYICDFYS
jgi:hypothetical protein